MVYYFLASHHRELAGSTGSAVDRPHRGWIWPDIQNRRPAGKRKYSRLLQRRSDLETERLLTTTGNY
jgi:hypothetical protein